MAFVKCKYLADLTLPSGAGYGLNRGSIYPAPTCKTRSHGDELTLHGVLVPPTLSINA